jgi:ubiquitin C-terminal hydrolase
MSDFKEDYRLKYNRWRNFLERDDMLPNTHMGEILAEMSSFEDNAVENEQKLSFINTFFPNFIRIILDKRYYHYSNPDYAFFSDFFSSVILFSLKYLKKEYCGLLEIIYKVLSPEKNYYDKHYTPISFMIENDLIASSEKKYQKSTEYFYANHSKTINPLFGINLNFFGNSGGFEKLVAFIQTQPGLEQVTQIMNLMIYLNEVMPNKVFKDIIKAIYKESITMVQKFTDEDFRLMQRSDLKSFFTNLEKMLDKKYNSEKIGKIVETCELEVAIEMLKTKYLEKRINGISEIVNKITQAKNLDEDNEKKSKGYYVYKSEYRETTKWVTSAILLEWIDSKDLINLIFGPTSHHEIIKRSTDLVKFMYSNSRFKQDHLKNLWEVAFAKHESVREALLNLIQDLIPSLYSEDLQFLYEKIVSLQLSAVDGQILQLAKSYTRLNSYCRPSHQKSRSTSDTKDSIIRIDENKTSFDQVNGNGDDCNFHIGGAAIPLPPPDYGTSMPDKSYGVTIVDKNFDCTQILNYLWSLWQEPALENGISKDISLQAISILKDSLLNYFRSERLKFLAKCIENIKSNSLVIWSCELMQAILESYPSVKVQFPSIDSKSSIIKNLDKDHHLISDLYKNLIQFKQIAIEKALELSGEDSTSSDEETTSEHRKKHHEDLFRQIKVCKEGSLNYVEEVKARLDFLKYIYSNSNESLTNLHIEVLWDCFIINASSESEYENLFNWLTSSTISWPNRSMLSDELQEFIFTNLLLKLDSSSYSLAAFSCFERFFININKQYRLLSNYSSDEHLEVLDIKLISMEVLWEIILEAKSDLVFMAGSNLMKRIYRGLKTSTVDIQEDFIKTCMKYISNATPAIIMDELSVNKISRCLVLLINFIEDFENNSNRIQDNGQEVQVVIKNQCKTMDKPREFIVNLISIMPWSQVREIIESRLGVTDKLVYLVRGNFIDSKQDNKTLEELDIDSNTKIIVNEDNMEDIEMMNVEGVPPPIDLEASLSSLRMIFEYLNDEILTLALEKSNNLVEEAVTLLTDEFNLEKLQKQLEKSKVKKKPVENYRLSNILTNTQDYFNLLFELFSFGNLRMNTQIWCLLSKIPVNERIYNDMKDLNLNGDWNSLLDSRCTFKLLYSLQIVNSIINSDDCEDWKYKFLGLGGLKHVYDILTGFKEYNLNPKNHFEAKVLDYLLRLIRIYISLVGSFDDNVFDYSMLISCIIDIIEPAIESLEETESVIENALGFLVILVTQNPNFLLEIYSKPVFYNLVSKCLVNCPQPTVRLAIATTVSSLVQALTTIPVGVQSPLEFFWDIVVKNFPTDKNPLCEEFFILATNLLAQLPSISEDFFNWVMEFIYNRESLEDRHLGNQDKVITGFLAVAVLLLSKNPERENSKLLEYLYYCLFDLEDQGSTNSPPKFKHPSTRKAAFEVMLIICLENKTNADILLNKLYIHHSTHKVAGSFDIDIRPRSVSGFVGLRNFSSTCYMNSLMQQLFMMEPIRDGILNSTLTSEENLEDNLLYQMQTIMANLLESEKEFYAPIGFCQAFKGYDGQSIDVRVQQDADEFLNLLFDKLEELIKNTDQANLLRNHIGGSLVHEIDSCETDFPYHGEREEHFYRISLDVKNKKSLEEALDLYIKDEMLEGDNKYHCEQYQLKVTAKKRCLLSTMANTVIIHLKRFEFDYSTMQRSKINDYCEFPILINFRNWAKKEDKSDEYYIYELAGVLLHSGVADSGHYTSIIKDRKSQRWYKFDDRYVEFYNPENLKTDCFGGETTYNWGMGSQSYTQTKNAYMLIYERKSLIPVPNPTETPPTTAGTSLLPLIRQKIRNENMDFLRDLLYFDQSYFELLKDFIRRYRFEGSMLYSVSMSETRDFKELIMITDYIKEDEARAQVTKEYLQNSEGYKNIRKALDENPEPEDQGLKLIKLGTLFAYEMLVRAKNYEAFKYWIKTLLDLYLNHIQASIWFLNFLLQNKEILSEILLECRDPEIRSEFSSFISSILKFCSMMEEDIILKTENVLNLTALPYNRYIGYNYYNLYIPSFVAVSSRFIKHYLSEFLGDFKRNCRRMDDYLLVLKEYAACGKKQKILLIINGAIQDLLSSVNDSEKVTSDYETDEIYKLLESLITCSKTYAIRDSNSYPPMFEDLGISLDMQTENYLSDFRVKRNLINSFSFKPVELIILHLCWENIKFSGDFLEEFSSGLISNRFDNSKVSNHLKIIDKILRLKDGVRTTRVKDFLEATTVRHTYSLPAKPTFFEQVQKIRESHSPFVMTIIVWWNDLMNEDYILESTKDHSAQFRWIAQETFNRYSPYLLYDYLNKGSNFENEFNEAIRKFRLELESDSEESVEIEVERFRYPSNPQVFKEDGEGDSTGSENP